MPKRRSPRTDAERMHGVITITDRIRLRYGQGQGGQTDAAIAREYGVSRQLVHTVLTQPPPLPRRHPSPMRPFVARFPAEQLEQCRWEARWAGEPLGTWLRGVIVGYLDRPSTE